MTETGTTGAPLGIDGGLREREPMIAGTREGSHPPRIGRASRTGEGNCRTEAVLSRMSSREEPAQRRHTTGEPDQAGPDEPYGRGKLRSGRLPIPVSVPAPVPALKRPDSLSGILCPEPLRANCLAARVEGIPQDHSEQLRPEILCHSGVERDG